jgi:hypothetical protein
MYVDTCAGAHDPETVLVTIPYTRQVNYRRPDTKLFIAYLIHRIRSTRYAERGISLVLTLENLEGVSNLASLIKSPPPDTTKPRLRFFLQGTPQVRLMNL